MAKTHPAASIDHNLTPSYDLAVIGAGAAGLSVTYAATRFGLKVALIERGAMGGECLNTGCIPSKALLATARKANNYAAARLYIQAAIAAIAPADSDARYTALGAAVIQGTARFTGRNSLEVNGAPLTARRMVLATGSKPRIPHFCVNVPHFTNETIWDLAELPSHMLILGGGPMAFEMAEAFSLLGAKITMIGGRKLLAREDPQLTAPLVATLRARGVMIISQRAVAAKPGPVLVLEDGSEIMGTTLLIAAGREVDTSALNIGTAGITAGPDGIKTDRRLRCLGNKNIFAAGDATDPEGIGPQRFTHIAGLHAAIIVRQAIFRLPARLKATPPVRVTYTTPELAQVGFIEREGGPGSKTLIWNFAENDRAIADGDTMGLIKLVLDRKARLIGAGIVGPGAGEMIGLYALAISQRTKLSALAGLVLPYPTRAEAGKRAIGGFLAEKLFAPGPARLAKILARLP